MPFRSGFLFDHQNQNLDFSFGGRTQNRYEMALELVSGADFRCVLHHLSSLTRLKGSWGQVWSENDPKPKLKSKILPYVLPSPNPGRQKFANEGSSRDAS